MNQVNEWHKVVVSAFRLAQNADCRLRGEMLNHLLCECPQETLEDFVKVFK